MLINIKYITPQQRKVLRHNPSKLMMTIDHSEKRGETHSNTKSKSKVKYVT